MEPEEAITASIEFVRIADMFEVTGMEALMAERIKAIILANHPVQTMFLAAAPDKNTHHLTSQHIESAALLPGGHPVRSVLASASVEGYLLNDNHKFWREARENPEFALDLLGEVKVTLNSLQVYKGAAFVTDPIRDETFQLKRKK
jgi:hypothetical protein